jgi:oligopeptidase A
MLRVLETLYQLRFELDAAVPVWHEDVQAYRAFDRTSGAELGLVFMDLFKRKNKQSGAWMNPACSRHKDSSGTRLPVTYLVCNAPKDVGQEPTFEFGEIVTLFHEMGHTLHNLLSEVDEEFFSGLAQVQHDAIELPSQFLENFCWDYSIVKELSAHLTTGEPLPESEFNNLRDARRFMAAELMLQGARYSLLDLELYTDPQADPMQVESTVLERWRTRPGDANVSVMADFPHIFGGGYAGGYYAYQWAEMLSSDSFAALREEGATFKEQMGAAGQFRQHVLAAGGVNSMAENFRAFRGRDPKPEFLLADYGISLVAEDATHT